MFGAFTSPQKRRYWPWILGVTAVFAGIVAIAAQRDPDVYNVVTPKGIKTVRKEMTTAQVHSLLGNPIASLSADDCFHYGWPTVDKEFDLYKVCYDQGRVRELKKERFEARRILGEDEELPPQPKPRRLEDIDVWGLPPTAPAQPAPPSAAQEASSAPSETSPATN